MHRDVYRVIDDTRTHTSALRHTVTHTRRYTQTQSHTDACASTRMHTHAREMDAFGLSGTGCSYNSSAFVGIAVT